VSLMRYYAFHSFFLLKISSSYTRIGTWTYCVWLFCSIFRKLQRKHPNFVDFFCSFPFLSIYSPLFIIFSSSSRRLHDDIILAIPFLFLSFFLPIHSLSCRRRCSSIPYEKTLHLTTERVCLLSLFTPSFLLDIRHLNVRIRKRKERRRKKTIT